MTTKIKKCPFCGGEGKLHRNSLADIDVDAFTIICTNCGATGPVHGIKLKALPPRLKNDDPILNSVYAAWNKRVDEVE